jgi:hypothetical protein
MPIVNRCLIDRPVLKLIDYGMAAVKVLSFLVSLVTLGTVLAGCTGRNFRFGEQFTFAPGQSVTVGGEVKVKFVNVTEDSRCPKGVQCIWAGQVVCLLELTAGGKTSQVSVIESGGGPAEQTASDYQFKFEVAPYPEAGKQISLKDYRLSMNVTK